jgi:tryptophan 2-monooxygenase
MPVMPNLRSSEPNPLQEEAPPVPFTYVDTPDMDYVDWLGANGAPIASIPDVGQYRVAVIGSGGGGLSAALELLRCGIDVTIFEATDRIGGRLYTLPAGSGDGNLFEMGAMRFTPSERVLHNYCAQFNASGASKIDFSSDPFPDPGDQDITYIAFQGQAYHYIPGASSTGFPPSYDKVQNGWKAFTGKGFKSADGSIKLLSTDELTKILARKIDCAPPIAETWQAYIDAFGHSSLYDAMVRIFTDPNAPGGAVWDPIDFEFFGALGTGFGGFGPLFPIGFLDIIRFVVNAVDSDQHELLTGVESIVQGFLNQPVSFGGGTETLASRVRTSTPVSALTVAGDQVQVGFADGSSETFDRVVVATSHRSMELTMGLGYSSSGAPLSETIADAIRRLHLENSSKVFAESGAFWEEMRPGSNYEWPRNVVGDTILRNLYALTYPGAPQSTGALLFSYTWAEDSVKQQAFRDPQARLDLLLRDLATIDPDFAARVSESIDPGSAAIIDWQLEPYYYGAFKLNLPGQDPYVQALFYDFQKASGVGPGEVPPDALVYLAGDSIGYLGGWVENALQTGVNAAAGVAVSLGGTLANPSAGPFEKLHPNAYNYGTAASARALAAAAE